MAALSLALGMADQIRQSSAAIHLDMMFIDEGVRLSGRTFQEPGGKGPSANGGGIPAHRDHFPCDGTETGDRGPADRHERRDGKPRQMADQLT